LSIGAAIISHQPGFPKPELKFNWDTLDIAALLNNLQEMIARLIGIKMMTRSRRVPLSPMEIGMTMTYPSRILTMDPCYRI
jgi:hypothetical protein